MTATEPDTDGLSAGADQPLTQRDAVSLAERYVRAYNDRDLEAMLTLQDESVVSHPSRLFGQQQLQGHAGVRQWWQTMVDSGRWYEIVIREIRLLRPDRVAVLGEIRDRDEALSPWGVVFRVRSGLIVESRSYLSDRDLLDELGLLE